MPNDDDMPDWFVEGLVRQVNKMEALRQFEQTAPCGHCTEYEWGEPSTFSLDCPEHGGDNFWEPNGKHLELEERIKWDGRVEIILWFNSRCVGEWSHNNRDCAELTLEMWRERFANED